MNKTEANVSATVLSDEAGKPLIDALCAQVDSQRMMRHLEEFAKRIKLSGSAEELESFQYLESQMRGFGYKTALMMHDAYISLPMKAHLSVGGVEPRCITHSFSKSSPAGGLVAEVVYVGAGRAIDFANVDVTGRIALISAMANPGASARASAAGALGQIHISPHEHIHEMCISPVWGSPEPDQRRNLPKTVVISIDHASGTALQERLGAGETLVAKIVAEVDTGWRKTPLLVAELATSDEQAGEPFVLFSGHHDTWYYGVMDNGSANATMLEVARIAAGARKQWKRGLRMCFWSGHSHGRYSGSTWYADTHWDELAKRCVAHVNVDSTGGKGNTVLADTPASAELLGVAREAVLVRGGQQIDDHRMGRAGDQSFWGIGIPSLFMGMSEEPAAAGNNAGAVVFGEGERKGAGFGWWWHTPDDTIDKIDPDNLVTDTSIYVHAVARLLTEAFLPFDYAEHALALENGLAEIDGKLANRFDLSPLVIATREVADKARQASDLQSHKSGTPSPEAYNAAIMAVGRALVPIDYTTGDRFGHDPALPQNAFPILDPLRALAQAQEGSDDAFFLTVKARRVYNRIAFALAEASAAFDRL